MNVKRKKYLFNLWGGSIVILWLLMIALLIRKSNFDYIGQHSEIKSEKAQTVKSYQREWMEIYLKGEKVGYSVNQLSPFREGYVIQEEIFLKLNLMGQASGVRTVTQTVVDHEFFLKKFKFKMTSGVVTFQASGKVEGEQMFLEIGEGAARRNESIKLSGPLMVGSGMPQFFKGRLLKVGQVFKFPIFDPSTMAQKEMVIKVIGRETVGIGGTEYSALRLDAKIWGQPMVFWLDKNGTVLKEQGFMGLTLVKSNEARAPRGIKGSGGKNFYELAAIKVKRKLQNSHKLTYLKLRVGGVDETPFDIGILDKGRQKYQGGARDGMIEVIQEKIPIKALYTIPYPDQSGKVKAFIRPEFNIESDERAIIKKAREIAGDAKDPIIVAGRLMAWVYRNIEKRPVVSVPSASEVLKSRVGDCNEHAVLLAALLRASGIPARLCVGLVYARDRFFYHAWSESWLGEWISMDATLNQMPADATHIKLVQGGLNRQVEIISLIGKLRLEVIDYRYD